MGQVLQIVGKADEIVWGPAMLLLLVGTGVFLTVRLHFLPWRNLGYALRLALGREARSRKKGSGDITPFSALTTALAATIGTGNIVGVATAMVSGGPGALVWMWVSAFFGLSSKFSECMLAVKYREVNEKGEMSGGPMYTIKKAFGNRRAGSVLGWLFALFAVLASFGIGNLTQANSISQALQKTFLISPQITGILLMLLSFFILVGGIRSISKVSSVVVPFMAVFYVAAGILVILIHIKNLPAGLAMIFRMAFSLRAAEGGMCGTITASMLQALRFGVARGVFSNEAGMGSAAITAAAAATDSPVRQGYINMTGTFFDTIVVCTITGLCIACSGVLGSTQETAAGIYAAEENTLRIMFENENGQEEKEYTYTIEGTTLTLMQQEHVEVYTRLPMEETDTQQEGKTELEGTGWTNEKGEKCMFRKDGTFVYASPVAGAALTILAFQSALGKQGGWMVSIGIVLFAFSTILGWEYHGEKAFEFLVKTQKFNLVYRIIFSLIAYAGATTALELVWNLSDIANALMAIPNLICLLAMSRVIARDAFAFQSQLKRQG
ncbi:MAG: amino acid carrier protein [Lachnospiraceae bacterium]|nr:amino acid carrier protein [Lachnospiraceae bacterium]